MESLDLQNDNDWRIWRDEFPIRADTTYLNHGSFGPTPRRVRDAQRKWQDDLASQPMDFFVRKLEPAWLVARARLARFLSTQAENLVFVENSTAGMNIVASSFPIGTSDEVLLTDHEYGAVVRIWERKCREAGAPSPRIAELPAKFESAEQVVAAIFRAATERTRLLIVSHVTSPTAVILPVNEICAEAKRRGIATCIDGPHAPAQVPVNLDVLECDFYTASLHKWVSAPIGSGFLYVAPAWHASIRPPLLSWGRLLPAMPQRWWEQFVWPGTRDPSAYLATSAALDLLEEIGLDNFRARTHFLARYARQAIIALTDAEPPTPDDPAWYGSMVSVPLPVGEARGLQAALWQRYGIEVPVIDRNGRRSIRVSCHLYTATSDIDRLRQALYEVL